MPTTYAAIEQHLGAATAAALANATMTAGVLTIDGVYDTIDGQPGMAGGSMQSQRSQFVFATAALGAALLAEDDIVTIAYRGSTLSRRVALRTDHEPIGQTVLDLALAS
ncbi:MAG: hypothetical protein ACRC2H_08365 [Silanimonas sp.]